MKRIAKRIFVAATIAAVSTQSAAPVSACGGRGGRPAQAVYGGYARAASNYRTTLPVTPPIHYARQSVYNQPVYSRTISAPSNAAAVQPRPRALVAQQTSSTALSSVARPANVRQLVSASTAASKPLATADAESSALAALASIAASSTTPTAVSASNVTTPRRGSFQATLPSNVTIQLQLADGGKFSWVVRNNGKTTQFSGQYQISGDRLTLVRGNDNQQMAGKLTEGENGFTFTLDGSNNAGLNFKRV